MYNLDIMFKISLRCFLQDLNYYFFMKMLFIQCEKVSSDAELQMQPRCHVLKLMLRSFYHNLNDFKIFQTSAT